LPALLILIVLIFVGWQAALGLFLFFVLAPAVPQIIRLILQLRNQHKQTQALKAMSAVQMQALKAMSAALPDGANVVPFVKATKEERERVMQIQGHRCANPYCNMDLRQSTPHWDHITPRSNGGTDSVHNMQWLCDTCNLNKKDMDWVAFLYRYATSLGIDPNKNQKPWQQWILNRTKNGLGT
jgi:hypothetical protein